MTPHTDWLDLAARRSAEYRWTLGLVFEEYCSIEGITRTDLAALVGCSLDSLAWMSLCRRPAADRFVDDVSKISDRFNVDASTLAHIVRRVDVVAALQQPTVSQEDEERMLLAARDRDSEEGEEDK
jgi:hypothetical protein